MESDQAQLVLSARVKLLKRQLLEWKTLLINQRKVREFANASIAQKPIYSYNAVNTSAELLVSQSIRLSNLTNIHKEELACMRARHQEEDASLEKAIETMKKKTNILSENSTFRFPVNAAGSCLAGMPHLHQLPPFQLVIHSALSHLAGQP